MAFALLVEHLLAHATGTRYLFVALAPSVAFAAWFGGFGPGMFSIGLAIGFTVRVILPKAPLGFHQDYAALATFAVCWLLVSILAGRVYNRLQREGEWRLEAERIAGQSDRLEQFTAAIAAARTTTAAVEACVQEAVYALGADAAAIWLVDEEHHAAWIARAIGYPPEVSREWNRVGLLEAGPFGDAVRRRSTVVFESHSTRVAEYGEAARLYASGHEANAVLPLCTGGRVVAVLRLDWMAARAFTADDHQFLAAISPRAAQALDRTAQYEAAQRARAEAERERSRADEELRERQRAEQALRASEARYRALAARSTRLHDLAAALSEAVSLQAVARALVHQGKIVVGATVGSVMLLDNSQFETVYREDHSGRQATSGDRFAAADDLCATAAVNTRQPVCIGSFDEWQERYPGSAALAADGGYVSCASLPLMIEGTPIGVLEFHFTVPVNFDSEYRTLLLSVAQHSAQALDRARLYESERRAHTEAETANKLKDDFLSVVSHELRTPLNSMLGWASLLQKGQLDGNNSKRALQAIRDNAARQAKLIDELLDFSRIMAGRARLDLQQLELSTLVSAIVESVLPVAAAKGVSLYTGDLPTTCVVGDIRRLEQVLFNLLGNALKFTPSGGSVKVEATARAGSVSVSVSDTGVGIEESFLPYVFDRFRQADSTTTRNYGGLGLGLSIAKQLVEAHGGTISAESGGAGRGAVFTITLPLADAGDEHEPARQRHSHAAVADDAVSVTATRLDGVRVLVVDDEADSREMMACALADCGAKVTVAAGAAEAWELLLGNEIDILLADIAMPEQDGYSFIRQVRSSNDGRVSAMPAIAVTAHAREEERRQALDAGFHLHLAKPFDPAVLANVVGSLLARRPGGDFRPPQISSLIAAESPPTGSPSRHQKQ